MKPASRTPPAATVRCDLAGLEPRDMVDLQSFLRAQGSTEYDG